MVEGGKQACWERAGEGRKGQSQPRWKVCSSCGLSAHRKQPPVQGGLLPGLPMGGCLDANEVVSLEFR